MPFETIDDLPEATRKALPELAQELYLVAFNSTWQHYSSPYQSKGENDRTTTSQRAAWAAVEQAFRKNTDGTWCEI